MIRGYLARLARIEERARETAGACQTCRGQGPDLLLAYVARKRGRPEEAVESCPECGRPGRFFFDLDLVAEDWETIKARHRRKLMDGCDDEAPAS